MSQSRGSVVVSQMGSRLHYAVPLILHRSGRLERLYTDFYWRWSRNASLSGKDRFLQRVYERQSPGIAHEMVTSFGAVGVTYKLALGVARGNERMRERIYVLWGRWFATLVARSGFGDAETHYAFKTAALESFQSAKPKGIRCCLEQISAPREIEASLLAEEDRKWPDWEAAAAERPTRQMIMRERAEWRWADIIVVGSDWVREGMTSVGVSPDKIRVVPYGVDTLSYKPRPETRRSGDRLKILYAGTVSLQKGIPYLDSAVRRLQEGYSKSKLSVKCAGSIRLSREGVRHLTQTCELLGRVPKAELAELYQWADVLVLPSICEGSAAVIYEALATGLPVITTPNSGSIVRDGVDGFVVSSGDGEALAKVIEVFLQKPTLLEEMSKSALERSRYGSVERYGERLLEVV